MSFTVAYDIQSGEDAAWLASRKRTAVSAPTDTSCETLRSAMVTPKSRFIRAMVIGLCHITVRA